MSADWQWDENRAKYYRWTGIDYTYEDGTVIARDGTIIAVGTPKQVDSKISHNNHHESYPFSHLTRLESGESDDEDQTEYLDNAETYGNFNHEQQADTNSLRSRLAVLKQLVERKIQIRTGERGSKHGFSEQICLLDQGSPYNLMTYAVAKNLKLTSGMLKPESSMYVKVGGESTLVKGLIKTKWRLSESPKWLKIIFVVLTTIPIHNVVIGLLGLDDAGLLESYKKTQSILGEAYIVVPPEKPDQQKELDDLHDQLSEQSRGDKSARLRRAQKKLKASMASSSEASGTGQGNEHTLPGTN